MIQDIKLHLLENNTGQVPGVKENPRDLTGDGFAKAKQSIKDFPEMLEVRTLVAVKHGDRFVVIGGNQRLRAMRDLDYDNAPVMVVDWSVDKINEFIIKDNVEYGVWNFDLLANEWDVQELMDWGLEVNVDLEDINDITEGLTDENEVPEILPNPKSKIGDVWICGNHRVMCGDSTLIDDVEKLMNGDKADILFASPPYNVGKTPNGNDNKYREYKDNQTEQEYLSLLIDFTNNGLLFSDYVFCNVQSVAGNKTILIDYLYQLKEKFADTIIWDKETAEPAMARRVLNSRFEYIHIFSNDATRAVGKKDFRGDVPNVFKLNSRAGKEFAKIHKATFRVELPEYFIDKFVETSVMDLFGGTGTTMIAAEKKKVKSFLMEIDSVYCDVIIKRWQDFTGKDAILESTQQKFNEL